MHTKNLRQLPLPEWQVDTWINTERALSLASLRGKVVLIHCFQMLCPGCVLHGLPQAERVRSSFRDSEVAVVGLHTVFEHHAVMTPDALRAFVQEYRWSFPIGIDRADEFGAVPLTMTSYGLRGTPSHLLLDRSGRVRLHHFGRMDDLALGALIGQLLAEKSASTSDASVAGIPAAVAPARTPHCTPEACVVDQATAR